MTKYSPPEPIALDRGFHALADATRRGVIAQLSLGEASVAELDAWITRYQQAWAARLDRLGDLLDATDSKGTAT